MSFQQLENLSDHRFSANGQGWLETHIDDDRLVRTTCTEHPTNLANQVRCPQKSAKFKNAHWCSTYSLRQDSRMDV
eukprot:scaffold1525_cov142-Cylindrotheca_fusiformis.AAC.75